MVDIKLSLFILQIRRINIRDRRVAIPFEESYFGILGQDIVYYAENKILYFGLLRSSTNWLR